MAITPQEFPKSAALPRSRGKIIWVFVAAVVLAATAAGWWFRDALKPLIIATPPPSQPSELGSPDFSILNDPVLRTLRRFDTLPPAPATTSRRSNPFAPF